MIRVTHAAAVCLYAERFGSLPAREVLDAGELTDADLEAIARAEPPDEASDYDSELLRERPR